MTHHAPQRRTGYPGTCLVEQRRRDGRPLRFAQTFEPLPIGAEADRVVQVFEDGSAERVIQEQPRHVEQRRTRLPRQGQQRHMRELRRARPPERRPESLEQLTELIGNQGRVSVRVKGVEPDRVVQVERIEQDHVVFPRLRD